MTFPCAEAASPSRFASALPPCPALSAAASCPAVRAILRVLAWNDDEDPPVPVTYGGKHAFSYVRAVQIIPMPLSWLALRGLPTSSPTYQWTAMSPQGTAAPLSGAHQHTPSYGAASPPVSPAQVCLFSNMMEQAADTTRFRECAHRYRSIPITAPSIPDHHRCPKQSQDNSAARKAAAWEAQRPGQLSGSPQSPVWPSRPHNTWLADRRRRCSWRWKWPWRRSSCGVRCP